MIGPVDYYESACYVGPLVLALAFLAVLSRPRAGYVYGLAAAAVAWLVIIFDFGPVQTLVNAVPHLNSISLSRGLMQLDFCLCLLGGIGLEVLLHAPRPKLNALATLGAGFTMAMLLLFALWQTSQDNSLTEVQRSIRYGSILWPILLIAATYGIAVTRQFGNAIHMRNWSLGVCALQAIFLIVAGSGLLSYSPTYFPTNQAILQVKQLVGNGLLGTYSSSSPNQPNGLGFLPETNIAYGVREFSAYDATLPNLYNESWDEATGTSANYSISPGLFSPGVTTATVAREYGVQFLIASPNPTINLPSNLPSRLTAALSGTQFATQEGRTAVTLVLTTYLQRPDVQQTYPWTGPSAVTQVFAWAAKYGVHDTPAMTPHASEIQSLSTALAANAHLQSAIGGLMVVAPPPSGLKLVKATSIYRLYAVLGSTQFSVEPGDAVSKVDSVTWVNNYTCKVVVDTSESGILLSRIADVPGWNATVNGRTAGITMQDNLLQQIAIPAGHDTVTLTYWPRSFTIGLLLAALAMLWLLSCASYTVVKARQETGNGLSTTLLSQIKASMLKIAGGARNANFMSRSVPDDSVRHDEPIEFR